MEFDEDRPARTIRIKGVGIERFGRGQRRFMPSYARPLDSISEPALHV